MEVLLYLGLKLRKHQACILQVLLPCRQLIASDGKQLVRWGKETSQRKNRNKGMNKAGKEDNE